MRHLLLIVAATAGLTWLAHDAWSASSTHAGPTRAAAATPLPSGVADVPRGSTSSEATVAPDRQLMARVAALESKLREAEVARDAEKQAADERAARARPAISEAEVGAYMQRAIDHEPRDHAWVRSATSAIEKELAARPHLQLEDVVCGRQFCRAAFFRPDGEELDSADVVTVVPLENEALTVEKPDHRMEVYFSRKGAASIEAIRMEQLALRRER